MKDNYWLSSWIIFSKETRKKRAHIYWGGQPVIETITTIEFLFIRGY